MAKAHSGASLAHRQTRPSVRRIVSSAPSVSGARIDRRSIRADVLLSALGLLDDEPEIELSIEHLPGVLRCW